MDTFKALQELGLAEDEARAYLSLTEAGPSSVLGLSRELNLPRTTLYRVLERLQQKDLVTFERFGRREKVVAQPPRSLERLLDAEQRSLDNRKKQLQGTTKELVARSSRGQSAKTYFYNGRAGLEQVTRNSLNAKDELLIFEVAGLNAFVDFLDRDVAENNRKIYADNEVHIREITNLRRIPAWTDVARMWQELWTCRYVPANLLRTTCECIIYNDVVAFYRFEGELFCIEVHSRAVAQMQRQLFEFVWSHGQPMTVGRRGAARLEQVGD